MLHIDKTELKIKGEADIVGAELGMLIHSVLEIFIETGMPREMALDKIKIAYELGIKSDEEIDNEIKSMDTALSEIDRFLDSLFGMKED